LWKAAKGGYRALARNRGRIVTPSARAALASEASGQRGNL